MKPVAPILLLALAGLALSACQEEKRAVPKGTAGGEILEGSVSDAMLPLDRVRSQPPLAPKSAGGDGPIASDAPRPVHKSAAAAPKPAAAPAAAPTPETAAPASEGE